MDLALGFVYAGYHLWKHRRPSRIDIDEPYLLNVPAEIRLIAYDFLFDEPDEEESASSFLAPLLTCRLIYQEAHQRAFARTNFLFTVRVSRAPYWTPSILRLPATKLACVRKITILWDSPLLEVTSLRHFFTELECCPFKLDQLTFRITNRHSLAPFRFKYAPLFPGVRDFAQYIMQELPLIDNVRKIVLPSPSIENKRNFQFLFEPNRATMRIGGNPANPTIDAVPKKLGDWKYTIVREGRDVTKWRLELNHPGPNEKLLHLGDNTSET